VTDTGIKELASLKALTSLDISGTDVTDDGMKQLVPLAGLTELDLSCTNVTNGGVAAFKKRLPKCEITW
jgi:hypothetical protein